MTSLARSETQNFNAYCLTCETSIHVAMSAKAILDQGMSIPSRLTMRESNCPKCGPKIWGTLGPHCCHEETI